MLPRDEQTFCSLSRHRSSAGGVVWAQQCSWLWQAALGRCRPADISRVLYVPLFSLGKPARVVLPWPGEEFMPDLPSTLGCHCCSSSWVPVGKCVLAFWRGARGDILVPPLLPPKGAGRPVPGGCFGPFMEQCARCIGLHVFDLL